MARLRRIEAAATEAEPSRLPRVRDQVRWTAWDEGGWRGPASGEDWSTEETGFVQALDLPMVTVNCDTGPRVISVPVSILTVVSSGVSVTGRAPGPQSMYVRLVESGDRVHAFTKEVSDEINVDFARDVAPPEGGRQPSYPTGVEVLGAVAVEVDGQQVWPGVSDRLNRAARAAFSTWHPGWPTGSWEDTTQAYRDGWAQVVRAVAAELGVPVNEGRAR
jgi:hypothetical protein